MMRFRTVMIAAAIPLFAAACADDRPRHAPPPGGEPPHAAPASPEVMEKVRACAAAHGVEMPAPHAPGSTAGAPPSPPPQMTDEQRAVVDACFKEQGIAAPPAPPRR